MVAEPLVARSGCSTATKAPAKPAMPSSLMTLLLRGRSVFTPGPLVASPETGCARAREVGHARSGSYHGARRRQAVQPSMTALRLTRHRRRSKGPLRHALTERSHPAPCAGIVGSLELPVRAPILGSL